MDKYADIRAALDAGPTLGKWHVAEPSATNGWGLCVATERDVVARMPGRREEPKRTNATYIAACSPNVIRALLAERDALREALTECLRVNETDAGADVAVWANAMLVARAALAKGES